MINKKAARTDHAIIQGTIVFISLLYKGFLLKIEVKFTRLIFFFQNGDH